MSQQYEEFEDDGQDDGQDDGPKTNSDFAALRRQTQATKRAEAEALKAKREAAFLRAGIDPEAQGIASYFVKAYEGDLDPVKIREAATAAGVLQPAAPDPAEQQRLAEQQESLGAQQRIAGAATAASSAPTPEQQNRAAMEEAFQKGGLDALTSVLAQQGIPQVEN